MEPHTPVKDFLQGLVSKGELNFFLVDPTLKALTRMGCRTVRDIQCLEDASWTSMRLPKDTAQKIKKQLPKLEVFFVVSLVANGLKVTIVVPEEPAAPEPSPQEEKKQEENKRARRISMELKNLNTEQQRELRKRNFSRVEKRRIVEENKRK